MWLSLTVFVSSFMYDLCASRRLISISIGGLDLVITYPIYACQPVEIWYNFTDADLPADQVLPDAGAVSFHTPNANQYQWMVVAPPIGTGVFSWTCPLPPGHKFVLRAVMDYEQILTVETPPGGLPKDCTEIPETGLGPEPTSTFIHGTMDIAVFESFARTKYPATSLSTEDAFGCVDNIVRLLALSHKLLDPRRTPLLPLWSRPWMSLLAHARPQGGPHGLYLAELTDQHCHRARAQPSASDDATAGPRHFNRE